MPRGELTKRLPESNSNRAEITAQTQFYAPCRFRSLAHLISTSIDESSSVANLSAQHIVGYLSTLSAAEGSTMALYNSWKPSSNYNALPLEPGYSNHKLDTPSTRVHERLSAKFTDSARVTTTRSRKSVDTESFPKSKTRSIHNNRSNSSKGSMYVSSSILRKYVASITNFTAGEMMLLVQNFHAGFVPSTLRAKTKLCVTKAPYIYGKIPGHAPG